MKERIAALWLLLLPLTIWAVHFLAVYVVAAIYCAKAVDIGAAIPAIRWIAAAVTVVALGAIGAAIWYGRHCGRYGRYGRQSSGQQTPIAPGSRDQARFVWNVLLLMSALSALAVIYVGSVTLFFGDCR
jgi:hypothetical protein